MPPLQVIGGRQDPGVAAASQFAASQRDRLRIDNQKKQLDIAIFNAKTNARNATTAEKKMSFEQEAEDFTKIKFVSDKGLAGPEAVKAIGQLVGSDRAPEVMSKVGAFFESMADKPESPQDRGAEASAGIQEMVLSRLKGFGGEGGQGGGDFPPGSSISAGPPQARVNLPLNPALTPEKARITAASGIVSDAVVELTQGVNTGKIDGLIRQFQLDLGNPLLAGEEMDQLISAMNALKGIVPFAKGGKQLTPFEAKLLFRLLDTKGKGRKTIIKDLDRFKVEFSNINKAVIGGTQAVTRQSRVDQLGGGQDSSSQSPAQFTIEEVR